MQYWLFHLKTWLYQIWQHIDAMKLGTDEEMLWGLLKILGFFVLGVAIILMFCRRKSQKVVS